MVDDRRPSRVEPVIEISRRRRGRSLALLVALLGLCALFYAITIVKMAHLG
jgi:hypothetical protein